MRKIAIRRYGAIGLLRGTDLDELGIVTSKAWGRARGEGEEVGEGVGEGRVQPDPQELSEKQEAEGDCRVAYFRRSILTPPQNMLYQPILGIKIPRDVTFIGNFMGRQILLCAVSRVLGHK